MKTYIIYLAAGNSRRFKEDKLHTLFKGKKLYRYGIDTLKQLLKFLFAFNHSTILLSDSP